jgi:dUTP pyrophosphatase
MDEPVIHCAGEAETLPEYQTEGASGADVRALLESDVVIEPGGRALVPTGLYLDMPRGLEAQVRPRSGLAARHGLTVLNSPGTIDSDYRGELKVLLVNLGDAVVRIANGDRIAQIVICPVVRAGFARRDSISGTGRGSGGFGSTGM